MGLAKIDRLTAYEVDVLYEAAEDAYFLWLDRHGPDDPRTKTLFYLIDKLAQESRRVH